MSDMVWSVRVNTSQWDGSTWDGPYLGSPISNVIRYSDDPDDCSATVVYEPVALWSMDDSGDVVIRTDEVYGVRDHREIIKPRWSVGPMGIRLSGFEARADGAMVGVVWEIHPYVIET